MTDDLRSRMERQFLVEQFYYDECALLDSRNFGEWIKLFAAEVHYFMPIRRTTTSNELHKEFTGPKAMAYFDDDRATLEARTRKLETGYAWAEDPPSRTRHLITNVRIIRDDEGELEVESNFHHYRTRLNSEEDNWIGLRRDVLEKSEGSFLIRSRHIFLEQTILLSRNLSVFF